MVLQRTFFDKECLSKTGMCIVFFNAEEVLPIDIHKRLVDASAVRRSIRRFHSGDTNLLTNLALAA